MCIDDRTAGVSDDLKMKNTCLFETTFKVYISLKFTIGIVFLMYIFRSGKANTVREHTMSHARYWVQVPSMLKNIYQQTPG